MRVIRERESTSHVTELLLVFLLFMFVMRSDTRFVHEIIIASLRFRSNLAGLSFRTPDRRIEVIHIQHQ